MNLILLGGQSILNKSWITEISNSLNDAFEQRVILDYQHWQKGQESMNLDIEINNLETLTQDLPDYGVFAKSLGAILALRAISDGVIKPKFLVICGLAYRMAEMLELPINEWLRDNELPTLIIQKDQDPAIAGLDLKNIISKLNMTNYKVDVILGDNHQYEDIRHIKKSLLEMSDL